MEKRISNNTIGVGWEEKPEKHGKSVLLQCGHFAESPGEKGFNVNSSAGA